MYSSVVWTQQIDNYPINLWVTVDEIILLRVRNVKCYWTAPVLLVGRVKHSRNALYSFNFQQEEKIITSTNISVRLWITLRSPYLMIKSISLFCLETLEGKSLYLVPLLSISKENTYA